MSRYLALALLLVCSSRGIAAEAPLVEKYLVAGNLAEGNRELARHLQTQPKDDEARFGLGTLEFLQAIEHLGQGLYKFGALGPESRLGRQTPLLRLAVPKNPKPAQVRYADVRGILQNLLDDLAKAEKTLAPIEDKNVKLPLHFGLIALDLNDDGRGGGDETLWRLYAGLNSGLRLSPDFTPEAVQDFVIAFDYGDASWLRGYCHLLSAMCEVLLAYDQERLFQAVAPHLFDNPDVPPIPADLFRHQGPSWERDIADAIAAIHLTNFPVKDPARMKRAHEHFTQVIRLSRESWKAIEAETDNDHEWVPNSKQQSVIPNIRVSAEMIAGWHDFLAETEDLLGGKKLIPHWQFDPAYGINLKRVFQEPREFDLVLWAHGIAAVPYAEKGPTTTPETWQRLARLFEGQFVGFAIWFN